MRQYLVRQFIQNVLRESSSNLRRLNSLSRQISRDIMDLIPTDRIKNVTHIAGPYRWPLKLDPARYHSDLVDDLAEHPMFSISVKIVKFDGGDEFAISANTESEYLADEERSIHIEILLPPKFKVTQRHALWKELIDVARHELEHFTQDDLNPYGRDDSKYSNQEFDKSDNDDLRYFLKSTEIPAFVRGFMRVARKKENLPAVIDAYLTKNVKPENVDIIKRTWIRWADINIP